MSYLSDAEKDLTATVTKVNNIAKSAVVSGTATPGAKVSIGSREVEADETSGAWSITVPGLSVGANELTVIQKIGGTEHDRKTVTVTIVEGGTVVPEPTDGVTLPRGETTTVPVTVKTTETRTGIDGQIVFEAPEGTTFAAAEDREVQYKLPTEDTWRTSAWLGATDGVLSDDDTTLTYDTVTTDSRFNLPAGTLVRFTADVATPEDARGGSSSVGYVFSGQSPQGDFKAEGQTTTTIETAAVDLQAEVSKVNNIAKTAVVTGTATPGAMVSIGEESVEADETTGEWSITVPALVAGPNELTVVQTIGGTKHDETKVTATIVEGGTLVGVDQGPVTLERGASTQVPFVVENREFRAGTTGSVTIDAPEGTTFNGQTTVQGSWRNVGATNWSGSSSIPLTNGRLSNDDKTLTFDVNWTSERPVNQQYRYLINVTADEDAPAGSGAMEFTMPGTSSKGDFKAEGKTATTIDEAVNPVAPIVVETPANGSTATDKRPVFSGTGDEGATIEITGSTGRVVATTVVKDGKWSVPAAFDLVDGSYALTATQTPLEGEKTTAPINFEVKAMVPVTLTAPAIDSDVSTPNPVFEGRGTVGATVVVKGTYGSVLATTKVKADGTWSVASSVSLAVGSYAGSASQTVNGKTTTAPFKFTVGQNLTPVTLETPTVGAEITDTKPVFTGKGQPGATVEVKGTYGTLLAKAEVKADGTWEATSDVTLANGTYAGKAWQTVSGKTTTADFRFTIAQSITPVTLETPTVGAEITDTKPVFTGKGQPGATVEVKGTYGTLLAKAEVKADGTWEATSDITLARGSYAGKAWQTVNGKTTTADFRFTVVAPMIPVSLTAPGQDAVVNTPNPVFSGKGTPNADITITGTSGTQLASGKVRTDGGFDLTSTIALGAGSYSGTVRQVADGKVTTDTFQFRIAFTAVTLESPAIGAALTDGTPVFSGKGTPKAPLVIKGSGGTTLAEGSVKDDGTWTLTSTRTLTPGSYTGTVLQSLPGSDTTAPFSFTVS